MKIQAFLKIAVVATAALAAYAFSGSAKQQETFYIREGSLCVNHKTSLCKVDGIVPCVITLNSQPTQVWSDLGCTIKAFENDEM